MATLTETISQQAPGIPIIGCCVPTQIERAVSLGALGHLVKPVTRVDLMRAIHRVDRPIERVLLVDDDPDALALFGQMLQVCDASLDVLTAGGGQEALEQLRRAPPDLMLLDIVMPDIDGWQVLAAMSREGDVPWVPTFVISAQDPTDQLLRSKFLLATVGEGLSLNQLVHCSLEVSRLLLEPEGALDLVPGQTREAARA
jgi:CheY-like chemotaxis protein